MGSGLGLAMTTPNAPTTPGQWLDALLSMPPRMTALAAQFELLSTTLTGMAGQVDRIDARTGEIMAVSAEMRQALTDLASGVNEAVNDIETLLDRVEAGDTEAVAEIRTQTRKLRDAVPDTTPTDNPTPVRPIPTDTGGGADPTTGGADTI